MKNTLFVVAHPDDAEVIFGHALNQHEQPRVLVASDGEASTVDLIGSRFCRRR